MTTGYLFKQAVFRDDGADMTHAEVMELLVAFIGLCEARDLHTGGTVTPVSEDDGARLPAEARKPGVIYDSDSS